MLGEYKFIDIYNEKVDVRWLLSKFKIKPNIYYNYRVLLFTKYHTKYEQSRYPYDNAQWKVFMGRSK